MRELSYIAFQGFIDERMERLIASMESHGWTVNLLLIHPRKGWIMKRGRGEHFLVENRIVTNPIMNELFLLPFFLFVKYLHDFSKLRSRVHLLYVHNFPDSLALPFLLLARLFGIPSVYEIRDPWKEFASNEVDSVAKARKRFKVYLSLISIIEMTTISLASGLVFVTTALQKSRQLQTKRKPLCLVPNYSDYHYSKQAESQGQKIRAQLGLEGNLVVSYIGGGFQPYRGVDVLLESIKLVSIQHSSVKLLIVGGHGESLAAILSRIKELGIEEICVATGWVQSQELVNYYIASDVGVIPHRRTIATEITIPNKLYDYLVLGKPVIVTSLVELSRLIEDGVNGLIVEADSPDQLAKGILKLARSPQLVKTMSESALKLGKKCTFASVEPTFIAFISGMAKID